MRTLVISFLITCLALPTLARKLHTLADFMKIGETSKQQYVIQELKDSIPDADYSHRLVSGNHFQVVNEDGSIALREFSIKTEAIEIAKKAEVFYNLKEYKQARNLYQKALELDSGFFTLTTYIGETYQHERDFAKAIEWYRKAIQANYIDYMAHWFLAECLFVLGQKEEAVTEIAIAQILNRNNPRLAATKKHMFADAGLDTTTWYFTPQAEVEKVEEKINVKFSMFWMGWAVCQAVWKYEENFDRDGVAFGESSLDKKECIAALITGHKTEEAEKYLVFRKLNQAIDAGMINPFILYEIMLREHPNMVQTFPKSLIAEIQKYVLEVRAKR